ncbi:MAG: hypothetical protein E7450_08520 [Ruminococcaceae bacterium]|nr:hypothetical protein [Oscillospiraceae bacterium]
MIQAIGLVLIAVLAENMVLARCMGFGWPKEATSSENSARRMGISITLVMVFHATAAWLMNRFVLEFFGLGHLRLLVYALLVPGVIWTLRKLLDLFFPALYRYLQEYLGYSLYNCAVMGAAYIITLRNYTFGQAFLYALASGVGVLLVLVIFTGMQDQASFESCPKWFRGFPIELITAGLMGLALMGFYGLRV